MPTGKPLSLDIKKVIKTLRARSWSYEDIHVFLTYEVGITVSIPTISVIVNSPLSVLDGPGHAVKRSGFVEKQLRGHSAERLKRRIVRMLSEKKSFFAWEIQMHTNMGHIPLRTFQRFLSTMPELGVTHIPSEYTKQKPLTKEHEKRRLDFACWLLYRMSLPEDHPLLKLPKST